MALGSNGAAFQAGVNQGNAGKNTEMMGLSASAYMQRKQMEAQKEMEQTRLGYQAQMQANELAARSNESAAARTAAAAMQQRGLGATASLAAAQRAQQASEFGQTNTRLNAQDQALAQYRNNEQTLNAKIAASTDAHETARLQQQKDLNDAQIASVKAAGAREQSTYDNDPNNIINQSIAPMLKTGLGATPQSGGMPSGDPVNAPQPTPAPNLANAPGITTADNGPGAGIAPTPAPSTAMNGSPGLGATSSPATPTLDPKVQNAMDMIAMIKGGPTSAQRAADLDYTKQERALTLQTQQAALDASKRQTALNGLNLPVTADADLSKAAGEIAAGADPAQEQAQWAAIRSSEMQPVVTKNADGTYSATKQPRAPLDFSSNGLGALAANVPVATRLNRKATDAGFASPTDMAGQLLSGFRQHAGALAPYTTGLLGAMGGKGLGIALGDRPDISGWSGDLSDTALAHKVRTDPAARQQFAQYAQSRFPAFKPEEVDQLLSTTYGQ